MNRRIWKVVYTDFSAQERRAVELINKELGALVLREKGVYKLNVLPVEKFGTPIDKNAVVIGLYSENDLIRKYIKEEEIPENGYVVKVFDNPESTELKLALITAKDKSNLFYGAVDFVDDYFVKAKPINVNGLRQADEIFDRETLPDYYNASAPAIKTRAIFTWGHPINDYRHYIDNMARMKLNQLIIWNDFVPVNASDIVDYAHSYGIQVIWGYSWGWLPGCNGVDLSIDYMEELTNAVVEQYEREYKDLPGDGIYFQSFTEHHFDYLGGLCVAEAVTDFVNKTADKLLTKYPDLYIQFGLHAWSVENHIEFIANVDKRVEIMWEDCGAFPYDYEPAVASQEEFKKAVDFTDKIIHLRKEGLTSVLFKGNMVLDWDRFVHQCGPYIMGEASQEIIKHDIEMLKPIWKHFQSQWYKEGHYAYDMAKYIAKETDGKMTVGIAGQFAGGHWFSEALCAQILWECDKPYDEILDKVTKRRCVDFV